MHTTGALGFSAEIEQKGDEKEFFLFNASPFSWKLFCLVKVCKYQIRKHPSYVELTLIKLIKRDFYQYLARYGT